MSYEMAITLLDCARNGADIPLALINQALELTGDLEHIEFSLADVLGVA